MASLQAKAIKLPPSHELTHRFTYRRLATSTRFSPFETFRSKDRERPTQKNLHSVPINRRLLTSDHTEQETHFELRKFLVVLAVNLKRGESVFFWYFFKMDLCLATSMERSRRDFFNDMVEHKTILKNNQNTHYSRFSFTPRKKRLPKTGVFLFH